MDALSYADLRDLPKEWDKKDVYILAIGLVSKTDGSFNYVALRKDENGKDSIVKDFGNIAAIRKIEKVYPYRFLESSFMPFFKTKNKEERIQWLTTYGKNKDYSNMTLKELDKEILNAAMQNAIKVLNQ